MSGDGSGCARISAFRARPLTAPRFSLGKCTGCVRACSVMSDSLRPHGLEPARLLCPPNLQARILEWVAISFSKGSFRPRDRTHVSCMSCIGRWVLYQLSHQWRPMMYACLLSRVWVVVTPWTVARQVPVHGIKIEEVQSNETWRWTLLAISNGRCREAAKFPSSESFK